MEESEFPLGLSVATFCLGIATVLCFYWYSFRKHAYWRERGVQYVEPYPFVGSSLSNLFQPLQDVELERHFKYGSIYGHYEGNTPLLSVADPELLKDILVKDFQYFSGRRSLPVKDKIMGNMLISLQGEDWKRIRSIVSPTFTSGKLKMMMSIFKECAETLAQNFRTAAEKKEPVDTRRFYGAFAMDIIASSAFSTKISSHNDPDNPFVKTVRDILKKTITWRFVLFGISPSIMRVFNISLFASSKFNFFRDAVHQITEERNKTGQTRNDFLQLLMDSAKEVGKEANSDASGEERKEFAESSANDDSVRNSSKYIPSKKNLSFDELFAQCLVFIFAGYDSTTSTICFATYVLALNQDVQDKARAEVDHVLEEHKGELTYEALQSMKYLDNVISETLRLYPPGARSEREAKADYKLGDTGITIPKGMVITIPVYSIHRDPKYYPDPEKFDPDRFCPEEKAKRDPFTYLPFGAGPRNCVAMRFVLLEVKVCLAYVISNFVIKRCSKTKVPLEFTAGLGLLRPKDIFVSVELRKDRPLIK